MEEIHARNVEAYEDKIADHVKCIVDNQQEIDMFKVKNNLITNTAWAGGQMFDVLRLASKTYFFNTENFFGVTFIYFL